MRGDRTLFLFAFADDASAGAGGIREQKDVLRRRFGDSGWECPQILEALGARPELYFDRVSQIRMENEAGLWSRNRVSLIGDAAFCVSLLAGQGSALAMIAAYLLAGELHRAAGDYGRAFARYQEQFAPFVSGKAEGRAASRRLLRAEIEDGDVLPQSGDESSLVLLGLGSLHRTGPYR